MDFLNKLYDSNYFGIGLFAVISFLVVTFLIVLFFGKKDEKKRKLENTNNINKEAGTAFKETTIPTKIEVPTSLAKEEVSPSVPLEPIVAPVAPLNYDAPLEKEEAKVEPSIIEPKPIEPTPVTPIMPESVAPVYNATSTVPNQNESVVTGIINETPNVKEEPPVINPTINYNYTAPTEPIVMEPVRFTPVETPTIEPLIKEEVKPLITPTYTEVTPIIEEPVINDTYYTPVESTKPEEINVPNIDFNALAESISKELDELEKSTAREANTYDEVKITPISEVVARPTLTPSANQFSSVYVRKEPTLEKEPQIDLPKKIDLPTRKDENM